MTATLVFNVKYPHAPEQIWQALTHSEALAAWLMDNDFKPCIGHRFQFKETSLPGLERIIDCEVISLEPPKRLAYTWQMSGTSIPSIVTWVLTPIEGGTQLQLHHSGLTTVSASVDASSLRPLLKQPWHGRQVPQTLAQPWCEPRAMLSAPDTQISARISQSPSSAREREASLEMTFESEWRYRLHEALPQALPQLVTVQQD